jgi:hypothetical protein
LFWQRRFDGSPSVLGKTIEVNLTPIIIIGVAPKNFSGASQVHPAGMKNKFVGSQRF